MASISRSILLFLALTGAILPSAHAAKSADDVCEDLAQKAKRTIWNSMRETGDELFCRKS